MPEDAPALPLDAAGFADVLTDYCLDVQPGEQISVLAGVGAAPLLLELQRAILQRDAWPRFTVELPGQPREFARHALDRQLDNTSPQELAEAEGMARLLWVMAPTVEDGGGDVDDERLMRRARARAQLGPAVAGKPATATLWPTEAAALQAGMTLPELAQFCSDAMMLDRPDPAAAWRELAARQQQLIDRLAGAREMRIEGEGTDLTLRVEGRTWINSDGRHNMPSGEVYTGPHETSANGRIRFTIPVAPTGERIEGAELELRDGVVVSARAERGDDVLQRLLETDDGARRVGELGIGTNMGIQRSIGNALFDEKIGGTVHLALGDAYEETGASNESAIHADFVCDLRTGGRLTADGELLIENGAFR